MSTRQNVWALTSLLSMLAFFLMHAPASADVPRLLHPQVDFTDTQGTFAILLGSIDPTNNPLDPSLFDQDLWLGITVDAETEMGPRQQIASVPFAIRSEEAENLVNETRLDESNQPGDCVTRPRATRRSA